MAEWMTPIYADTQALNAARDAFTKNNPRHIQLRDALRPAIWKKLWAELQHSDWQQHYLPDVFHYKTTPVPREITTFFSSQTFCDRITQITGKTIKHITLELHSFEHRNYTLLHDEAKQPEALFLFLELTTQWNPSWGGFTSFVKDEEELLRLYPVPNTLTLVHQQKNTQHFTKYVNFYAGKHRRIVLKGTCR